LLRKMAVDESWRAKKEIPSVTDEWIKRTIDLHRKNALEFIRGFQCVLLVHTVIGRISFNSRSIEMEIMRDCGLRTLDALGVTPSFSWRLILILSTTAQAATNLNHV
jgi:hypothetical protein